jgi:hypothetical protein
MQVQTVQVINLLVLQKQNHFLCLEHSSYQTSQLRCEWNQETIVTLVCQPFEVLNLVILFFADVVLHLVRYQPGSYFCANLLHQSKVIGSEFLVSFFVGHFKAANCVVSQFNRHEHDVSHYLMQLLLVYSQVFS